MLAAYLSLVNAISPEPLVAGESLMVTTSLHELSESTLQGRGTLRIHSLQVTSNAGSVATSSWRATLQSRVTARFVEAKPLIRVIADDDGRPKEPSLR